MLVYSKSGCPNCEKVKFALTTPEIPLAFTIINCDESLREDKDRLMQLLTELNVPEENRAFPFVFVGDRYLGGYRQLLVYLTERELDG